LNSFFALNDANDAWVDGYIDATDLIFNSQSGGNVGIGTTSPAGLFDVNGKLTVLSGGNVGIGTTTPGSALDVNGIIASDGISIMLASAVDRTGVLSVLTSPTAGISLEGTNNSVVATGNNSVLSGSRNEATSMTGTGQTLYGSYNLANIATGSGTAYGVYSEVNSSAGSTAYALYANAGTGAGTEYAGVFLNGNVGIGTASPGYKLDISGSLNISAGQALYIGGSNVSQYFIGSAGTSGQVWTSDGTGAGYWATAAAGLPSGTEGQTLYYDGTTSAWLANSTLFYDDTNSRVGIGTTAPASMLSLYGSANALRFNYDASNYGTVSVNSSGDFSFVSSNTTSSAVIVGNGSSVDNYMLFDGAADFYLGTDNDDSSKFKIGRGSTMGLNMALTIDNTSNVGIGTTAPGSTFQINGNAAIGYGTATAGPSTGLAVSGNVGIGTTTAAQALSVNGRISMATWTADGDTVAYRDTATNSLALATSDRRLKKNIVPLENAMDIISQLNAYKYNELDEPDGSKLKLGIMSQEALPIIPELTFAFTNEGSLETYYGIHYDKLPVLLLKGINEQQQEMAALKSTLNADLSGLTSQTADELKSLSIIGSVVDDLTARVEKIENAKFDERIAKTEQNIAAVNEQITQVIINIDNLNQFSQLVADQIDSHEQRISALELAASNEKVLGGASSTSLAMQEFDKLLKYSVNERNMPSFTLEGELKVAGMSVGRDNSGEGLFEPNQMAVLIPSASVKANSRIYITPVSKMKGRSLYVEAIDIVEGQSFVVKLDGEPMAEQIKFNWFILGQKE
jgi:hypothetical protein